MIDKQLVSLQPGHSVDELAAALGLQKGVSGYCYHTVPVCLYAWARHFGDFRATVEAVIRCGGDADTTGAIAGALAAVSDRPPEDWIQGIADWPISTSFLRRLGSQADHCRASRGASPSDQQPPFSFPGIFLPLRNVFFLVIVLLHGLRRLLPW